MIVARRQRVVVIDEGGRRTRHPSHPTLSKLLYDDPEHGVAVLGRFTVDRAGPSTYPTKSVTPTEPASACSQRRGVGVVSR